MCLQNNMNYSSLAILSRCPQAPVPNLGQYDHHSVPSSSPSSTSNEGQNSLPPSADPLLAGDLSVPAIGSADVRSASSSERSTRPHGASANVPPQSGHCVPASGVSLANMTDSSSSRGLVGADEDDFDDFKSAAAASLSRGSVPLNHVLSVAHARHSVPG